MKTPDVDELVKLTQEAVNDYKFCKDRIDSAEKLIREALRQLTAQQNQLHESIYSSEKEQTYLEKDIPF